ncbi:MAG: amidase [Polyangiaceae bacterium]|nr:amidase [Polyangiaceae bacterium]
MSGAPADLARDVQAAIDVARAFAAHHFLISLDEPATWQQVETCAAHHAAGGAPRPLEGVLVAIKDQLDVQGAPTTCGTTFCPGLAAADAEAVARLRAAGAVIFGKANMHELALGPTGRNIHYGDVANPWDPRCDAGGSSSGSAALVAAGVTPLALGTDLGGSVRIPAAFCGVPSLKPTFGAIPTAGVVPVSPTLEHVGIIGRDIDILRRAFRCLGPTTEVRLRKRKPRVGICEAWWDLAEAETGSLVRSALEALKDAGAVELETVHLPSLSHYTRVGALISTAEASKAWAWSLDRKRVGARRGPSAASSIALAVGCEVREAELERALVARRSLSSQLDEALRHVDVLATPTTPSPAGPYDDDGSSGEVDEGMVMSRIAFTMPFNLSGLPAVQVPCGFAANGMPVGLQLVGPRNTEALLLALGAVVEARTERRIPRISASRVGGST